MGYKLKSKVSLKSIFSELDIEWKPSKDYFIDEISSLSDYSEGSLTFCNKDIPAPKNSILITNQNFDNVHLIYNTEPRVTFIRVLDWMFKNIGFDLYKTESEIDSTASIGQNVVIESGCFIGENVVIEPNVVIHNGTVIGNNCLIKSCTSIGSDGFGFERLKDGTIIKFPHLGRVVIGNGVEIGSCTSISRGTLSDTVIHDNVKISNQVQIAHNVEIHEGAMIAASAEVSGSVIIGRNTWIAPNSCINHKVRIGQGVLIGLGAVVIKDVEDNNTVVGNPAKELIKNFEVK